MITLDQIRMLETKVHKAVSLLSAAQEENQILKSKLAGYETRIDELEFLIEEFRDEQTEIEQGIISALNHLDHLEDTVGGLKEHPGEDMSKPGLPLERLAVHTQFGTIKSGEDADEAELAPEIVVSSPILAQDQNFSQPEALPYEQLADPDEEEEELPEISRKDQQLDIF